MSVAEHPTAASQFWHWLRQACGTPPSGDVWRGMRVAEAAGVSCRAWLGTYQLRQGEWRRHAWLLLWIVRGRGWGWSCIATSANTVFISLALASATNRGSGFPEYKTLRSHQVWIWALDQRSPTKVHVTYAGMWCMMGSGRCHPRSCVHWCRRCVLPRRVRPVDPRALLSTSCGGTVCA